MIRMTFESSLVTCLAMPLSTISIFSLLVASVITRHYFSRFSIYKTCKLITFQELPFFVTKNLVSNLSLTLSNLCPSNSQSVQQLPVPVAWTCLPGRIVYRPDHLTSTQPSILLRHRTASLGYVIINFLCTFIQIMYDNDAHCL